jgi:hypothetical protein
MGKSAMICWMTQCKSRLPPIALLKEHQLRADGFGGFDHTATLDLPTACDHEPMHQQQSQQLGREITEHMPGLLDFGGIGLGIVLPQLKEQLSEASHGA